MLPQFSQVLNDDHHVGGFSAASADGFTLTGLAVIAAVLSVLAFLLFTMCRFFPRTNQHPNNEFSSK